MTPHKTEFETKSGIQQKGGILERLQKGIVLGAEGYLFELERRGYIKAGAYVPEVVLDHPEALQQLHREFLRAGSEVLVAFTYYAHRDKLRVIGRENDLEALNVNALKIAKEIAKEANNDVLVAGNICNTWVYDVNDKERTEPIVRQMYDEQVGWAKEAGVDFIICETLENLGEGLIALEVIKKYDLPAMITLTPFGEKTQDGYDWVEACKILADKGTEIVGFNCCRGPEIILPLIKELRKTVKGFIAAQPVPYHTTPECPYFQNLKNRDGSRAFSTALEQHLVTRKEMGKFAKEAQEIGVNYIGVCCGGAPYYVREMAEALGRIVPASKYSADMSLHGMLGSENVVKKHQHQFAKVWEVEHKQQH